MPALSVRVRVLSDQSVNIGPLVCALYFDPCFVLWYVVLWWPVTSLCFFNHLEVPGGYSDIFIHT